MGVYRPYKFLHFPWRVSWSLNPLFNDCKKYAKDIFFNKNKPRETRHQYAKLRHNRCHRSSAFPRHYIGNSFRFCFFFCVFNPGASSESA